MFETKAETTTQTIVLQHNTFSIKTMTMVIISQMNSIVEAQGIAASVCPLHPIELSDLVD